MPRPLLTLSVAAALFRLMDAPAAAHDIYTRLYSSGEPGVGRWCCSGDPVTGDCEAVGEAYRVEPDGAVVLWSERYQASVRVGGAMVTWMAVPGGEGSPAHWCGKPRDRMALPPGDINAEQPDPAIWTYCAFITPGGV